MLIIGLGCHMLSWYVHTCTVMGKTFRQNATLVENGLVTVEDATSIVRR